MKNSHQPQKIFASIVFSFIFFTLIGAQLVPKQCNHNNVANGREIHHSNTISLENQTNSKVTVGNLI